jgi:hypothetical protein
VAIFVAVGCCGGFCGFAGFQKLVISRQFSFQKPAKEISKIVLIFEELAVGVFK